MKKIILTTTICLSFIFSGCKKEAKEIPQKDYLTESKEDKDTRMEWWRDARFGMFIHWGLYAIPAGEYDGKEVDGLGEWIMRDGKIPLKTYEQYAKAFNPVQYEATTWVKMAKDAGMKYIVLTSKHHDGFALWDSKVSKYDIMDASPYKKDIIQALSDECKKQGIRLCFYHSIMDWHHPDANPLDDEISQEERLKRFPKYREEYLKPQLKELLTQYDNIGVMWFDGEWIEEWTEEQGRDLYNYLRNIQPGLIINNRISKGRQGFQGMSSAEYCGDFGTPEQQIHDSIATMDWETCMTMNDTWGFKKNDHNWKSSKELILQLIDASSKGGNYLLNVGPTAEGLFPQESVDRLKDMGDWMKVNSEAIYGTHNLRNYKEGNNIRFTQSKNNQHIYIFSFTLPEKSLTLHQVKPKEGSNILLLGHEKPLEWKFDEQKGLTITIPKEIQLVFSGAQTIAYTFKIEGEER